MFDDLMAPSTARHRGSPWSAASPSAELQRETSRLSLQLARLARSHWADQDMGGQSIVGRVRSGKVQGS